ncbi:hypothetical protein D030_5129A, partial [Vibrio parahaemolyticus AQ3810]
MLLVEEAEVS